ncbi:MAG: hypothetical protein QM790_02240 [Nibricoccus sp.]
MQLGKGFDGALKRIAYLLRYFVSPSYAGLVVLLASFASLDVKGVETPVYYNLSFQAFLQTQFWTGSGGGVMQFTLTDETGKVCTSSAGSGGFGMGTPVITSGSGAVVTAKILPNKDYVVTVTGSVPADYYSGSVRFTAQSGQSLYVNGYANGGSIGGTGYTGNRNTASQFNNKTFKIRISLPGNYSLSDEPSYLRGGECTSLPEDRLIWYVGLGGLRNGDTAGTVGFRRANFGSSDFFSPTALYYTAPDESEISVVKSAGSLRQIYAREVLLDVQLVNSTSYRLDFYARSQVTGQSSGVYTFSGTPFVRYLVERMTVSNGDGVKITRTEDNRSWETSLSLSGNVWVRRDWRAAGGQLDAYSSTNYTSDTGATVTYTGPDSSGAAVESPLVLTKSYTDYTGYDSSWGKELTQTLCGAGEATPLCAQTAYYTTTSSDGAFARKIKHQISTDGSWEKYAYFSTTGATGTVGALQRVYKPWGDGPASPDNASTTNCIYTDYIYSGWYSDFVASTTTYAPGGTMIGKTTWDYSNNVAVLNGIAIQAIVKTDYYSSSAGLATSYKNYQYNMDPAWIRNKPASAAYPDGRKKSWAYFSGTWDSSNKTFTASASGGDRLVLIFDGQTTGGTAVSSWTLDGVTWAMDSVQMVANRSTVTEQIIASTGQTVFAGNNVYTSSGTLARISGTLYRYDTHGRLAEEVDIVRSSGSNELKVVRTYVGSMLDTVTAVDGVVTKYEYDSLLRLVKTSVGYGGSASNPARITENKYDGAGRLAEVSVVNGGAPTTYVYDAAGRISSGIETSPNGESGLATIYAYPSQRVTTMTLPTGATRIYETYLDGRPKSMTGTAQAPNYWLYAWNSTGLQTTLKNGMSLDNGWIEQQVDMLGRVTNRRSPTWSWGSDSTRVLKTELEYNSAGQLWRERLKLETSNSYVQADVIRTYDAAGRPLWVGADVDNSGSLSSSSNDRITAYDQWYESDAAGWVSVSCSNTCSTSNSSVLTPLSYVSTRLTGFNNSFLGTYGYTVGDVVTVDKTGRSLHQIDMISPSQRLRRSESQISGTTVWAYSQSINGYTVETSSQTGVRVAYEYDSLGRVEHVRSRLDGSTYAQTTSYSYWGSTPYINTVNDQGISQTYSYTWGAPIGSRQVSVTDASNYVSHTLYNEMVLSWRTWGSGASPTEIVYDNLGRRVGVKTWRSGSFSGTSWPGSPGPADSTTWDIEAATGLLKRKTYADDHYVDYTYTPVGKVASRTNARNITTSYAYFDGSTTSTDDVSHRTQELRAVTYSDGTPSVSYSYTRTGALAGVSDATGSRSFSYRADLQLDVESLDSSFFGSGRSVAANYDNGSGGTVANRSNGYALQSGDVVEASAAFTFSSATGRIETAGGQNFPSFTYGYTAGTDWVESVASGSFGRTQALHDARAVLKQTQASWSGVPVATYDSEFNSRGHRSSLSASGSVPGTTRSNSFLYDGLGRLSSETDLSSAWRTYSWGYDLLGNRQNEGNVNGTVTYSKRRLGCPLDVVVGTRVTGRDFA